MYSFYHQSVRKMKEKIMLILLEGGRFQANLMEVFRGILSLMELKMEKIEEESGMEKVREVKEANIIMNIK